ncbi:hypothetical protein RND81_10G022400 [Saponaria officinalis]|uniref:Gnk2-homologous domain-containing protein n=1 Tax=Saponaria officinalis TaxID=3572 RepID=A0AAW1HZJ7_SAPOF
MVLPMFPKSQITYFVTILFFVLQLTQTLSQFHYFGYYCDETIGNYTKKSDYKTNLNLLLPKLTDQASESHFDNHTVGEGIDKTYGLYLCRGDLNDQQCHDCIDAAVLSASEKCPVEKSVIVWYEECMVRYSNQSIFEIEDETLLTYSWSTPNVTEPEKFQTVFGEAVDTVIDQAAYNESNKGYATAEEQITLFQTVYVMGICTPDIIGNLCERCLRVALSSMAGCCGTARVNQQMYLPSCWLRYDNAPFLLDSNQGFPPESSPDSHSSSFDSPPSEDSPPTPSDITIMNDVLQLELAIIDTILKHDTNTTQPDLFDMNNPLIQKCHNIFGLNQ